MLPGIWLKNMPGITLLSVEVFNALYSSTCMQNAGSRMTYVAILTFDLVESVLAFRDIRSQVEQLNIPKHGSGSKMSLPQLVMELSLEPGVLDSKRSSSIRLRSSVHFKFCESHKKNLTKIEVFLQSHERNI